MLSKVRECLDELLLGLLEDWVDLGWVVGIAIEDGGARTLSEERELAMAVIRAALVEGLAVAGDLEEGGVLAWGPSPEDALTRIAKEWDKLGRPPGLGEVCWLDATELGRERGLWIEKKRGGPP